MDQVKFVHVPYYDELKPESVLNYLNLGKTEKQIWSQIKNYCPELNYKSTPKDREFFFNILNTLIPN
jgi:hypothetical protein